MEGVPGFEPGKNNGTKTRRVKPLHHTPLIFIPIDLYGLDTAQ